MADDDAPELQKSLKSRHMTMALVEDVRSQLIPSFIASAVPAGAASRS